MGLPYSKQVQTAVAQVTPLVAAGFEALQTTKNLAVLLAGLQVLIALTLAAILAALVAVALCLDPALEAERAALVTPVLKWGTSWLLTYGKAVGWLLRVFIVASTAGLGLFLRNSSVSGSRLPGEEDADDLDDTGDGGEIKSSKRAKK